MKLYLIRHGDPAPLGEGGVTDDAERPLTEAGRKQIQVLGKQLAKHGEKIGLVITSPHLRAKQTAEILLETTSKPAPELRECNHLACDGSRKKLVRFLREVQGDCVALVGHQPDLSALAGWLIGSKKAQINLAKAGVACIVGEGVQKGGGVLVWLLTPEWMG